MPILKNCGEKTLAIGFLLLAGFCIFVEISYLDTESISQMRVGTSVNSGFLMRYPRAFSEITCIRLYYSK